MLTCIACSKQLGGSTLHDPGDDDDPAITPSTRHAIRALTAQIKGIALRHCRPCAGGGRRQHVVRGYEGAERFQYAYRRAGEGLGSATPVAGGASSGEATPSMSGRSAVVFAAEEEEERREWVAQVEPGVLITFLSLPRGGNDLRRIRFSRDMFNKWQAQRWWADNYDKVMELYNVRRYDHQAMPLPTPPRSEDESSKVESEGAGPMTPPLGKERLPRNINHHRLMTSNGMSNNSSDSLDHQHPHGGSSSGGGGGLASTPKLSSISGAKTETSSMDASGRTTSSSHEEGDRSEELSMSNASDQETEWVEQDDPGVYITIRALPNGTRELRRIRFSRERFGEMHARLWWEENRARIHEQYL